MTGAASEHTHAPAGGGAERRSRLRQYQVQLLERMQAAKTGAAATGRELGLQFGDRRCLLDLTQIGEIVPFAPVSAVPLTQDWYLGLANVRGQLTGIIDLARYQGDAPTAPAPDSRLVTFSPALGFNCALLAARVLGLRNLADMTPGDGDAAPAWRSQHFLDRDGQQWTRLDLGLLVREARFLHVGL